MIRLMEAARQAEWMGVEGISALPRWTIHNPPKTVCGRAAPPWLGEVWPEKVCGPSRSLLELHGGEVDGAFEDGRVAANQAVAKARGGDCGRAE